MKNVYLIILFLFGTIATQAQEFITVYTAASYDEQVLYQLSDDATYQMTNDSWDIAFSFAGDSSGIFINEAVRTSFGSPQAPVHLFYTGDAVWSDVIIASDLDSLLGNNEASWNWGAFNATRDTMDYNDYGWGVYDATEGGVISNKLFVLHLRSGEYKKIEIESLIDGAYAFRYADLDGSNEVSKSITKDEYPDNTLAFFTFGTGEGEFLDEASTQPWDLMFTRYLTPIFDVPFSASGVLSDADIQVAEARGISPADATYDIYSDSLSYAINVIGHDWKGFDNGWQIEEELSFFVLTPAPGLWKLVFYGFEGSSTGGITFEKTDLSDLVMSTETPSEFDIFALSPNPASTKVEVIFNLKTAVQNVEIAIFDINGKMLSTYNANANEGLNVFTLNELPRTTGVYLVRLASEGSVLTQKLVVE